MNAPSAGPAPLLPGPLAAPAAWLYGLAVRRRNARYDRGRGVRRVAVPVVSVGNLSTGGTGKTPMVQWVVERLATRGHRPVIAMRGYAARRGERSDEHEDHLSRLDGVEVVADPDRAGALQAHLAAHPEVTCAVLDDGFQHRRLARDLDIVLIDATAGTMSDHLLPRGRLREPLDGLRRADAVVITRAGEIDARLAHEVARRHGRPPLAWSRHAWECLEVHGRGGAEVREVEWLAARCVVTMLGVGNPGAVRRQVEAAGASVAADLPVRDHERYDRPGLAAARERCGDVDAMLMTNKDWVKVRRLIDLSAWPVPIVVPRLRVDVFAGAEALETMILEAASMPAEQAECRR